MAKRNPPKRRIDLSRGQAVAYFLRLMERQRDRRLALSSARLAVDSSSYRDVLQRLVANPTYRWAVVADPFPATPAKIQKRIQLAYADVRREFIWSAEVLRIWEGHLREFVQYRIVYERYFLNGHYEDAKQSLDQIETKFGWSIWLVASRIQLLALSDGLQAQKKFLEDVLAQDISPLLGWVSYYCSLRSEENYSLASIQEVIEDTRHNLSLYDYATYHLNPYAITRVQEAKHLLSWEEVNPLIDRLHAHVVAARIYLSGDIDTEVRNSIFQSLEALRGIEDPGITRLLGESPTDGVEDVYDLYVENQLEAVASNERSPPEVRAIAYLQDPERKPPPRDSVVNQVAQCMMEMLLPSDAYVRNRQQLQKYALVCGHLGITREIASFVARRDIDSIDARAEGAKRYASLGEGVGELCLPSFADSPQMALDGRVTPASSTQVSEKAALALLSSSIEELPRQIPSLLKTLYRAQILLATGSINEAEDAFKELSSSLIPYFVCIARVGLFRCSLGNDDLVGAVQQCVAHSLQAPDLFRLYPLTALAERLSASAVAIAPLLRATLFHFASKANSRWNVVLSDSYENVLTSFGCEKPSQLTNFGDTEIEIYFLRNICTPRVMEDSTAFESVEEVENERIAICQKLIEVDPDNTQAYADEIKTITRNQNVSTLLHHVESNMVYVDAAGVSSVVHDSLKESFERYQVLLSSPSLEYQAEQITKMIKGLMSKLRDADVRDLAAPASSERLGLFEQMQNYFVDTFALHPAFGLDTNLSTSIRHGVIEGHIRAAFVEEQLLSNWDKATQSWVLPEQWREKLVAVSAQERSDIEKAFARFAARVADFVKLYRDELIQIRRVEAKRQGLFFFKPSSDEIRTLADSITVSTTYEEFLALMFDHAWTLVDRSMMEVKARIRGELLAGLNSATETFATSLNAVPAAKNAGLINAVARAKTVMQVKVEEIANWFKRPTDVSDTPFEIELALLVALKQIENCFTGQPLSEIHFIDVDSKFSGAHLNGLVEVVFLFLQNAIKHGGFHTTGKRTPISIRAFEDGEYVVFEFENDIAPEIDLAELKHLADEALVRHSADSDLAMAPSEGRSGLSKLKRILRFDIRREYVLRFDVAEEARKFRAVIRFKSEGLKHADIHS